MSELETLHQRPPLMSAFYILLTVLCGFYVLGPLIGFFLSLPFYEGTMFQLAEYSKDPIAHPEIKSPFLMMQAGATFLGLIVGPMLYWFSIEKRGTSDFIKPLSSAVPVLTLTALVVLAFMGPNSLVIDWNAHVTFPESLKNIEDTFRDLETRGEELTKFFTIMDTNLDLVTVMVVVAILPAIGEELVFRGMLQTKLQQAFGNPHAAIWLAAVLFSAIHLQFFGFFPRVFLGALFGYLYWWSGNLAVPVFAHFVNNEISVVALYLQQRGLIGQEVIEPKSASWSVVITGALLTFGLLVYLKKTFDRQQTTT